MAARINSRLTFVLLRVNDSLSNRVAEKKVIPIIWLYIEVYIIMCNDLKPRTIENYINLGPEKIILQYGFEL